jgi:hypothetical protein
MLECAEEGLEQPSKGGLRYFPLITSSKYTSLASTFSLDSLHGDIFNLGLLIIEPGATTQWQRGTSRGYYRYHYALRLPSEGEFGLYLQEVEGADVPIRRIKWRPKQGFIWDTTLRHQLRNQSMESCFILVADIPRQLSWECHWFNHLLHLYFPHT